MIETSIGIRKKKIIRKLMFIFSLESGLNREAKTECVNALLCSNTK